jgi:hypothetical protein
MNWCVEMDREPLLYAYNTINDIAVILHRLRPGNLEACITYYLLFTER